MSYSQHNEELFITEYFRGYTGTLLSIGENDGITYSNVRELILRGWEGYLVEPAPEAFKRLQALYKDNPFITLINKAIGTTGGPVKFYDSGEHVVRGTTSLLATVIPSEMDRWPDVPFQEIEVDGIPIENLVDYIMSNAPIEFISIDAEGMDFYILQNMPFDRLGTKCVCVEFNGKNFGAFNAVMKPQGFKLIHENSENLIFAKDGIQ
jgi:FkbM family methyltransferase